MKLFLIACCFVLPGALFSQLINTDLVKREAFVEDSLRQAGRRAMQRDLVVSDSIYRANERKALRELFHDTLYTWTRKAQIEQLRKNNVLLTKSRSEKKGASLFDEFIHDSSVQNDVLMKLLCEERFAKKRFAWTDSWATVMGWRGESYGDQLIQMVLHDSALIGVLTVIKDHPNGAYKLIFLDRTGNTLETEDVLKNTHRIAAVLHTTYRKINKEVSWYRARGTFPGKKGVWRRSVRRSARLKEYVIINENMIRSWSYGTPSITKKMDAEVHFLELLRDSALRYKPSTHKRRRSVYDVSARLRENYFNRLCFQNKKYDLKEKRIRKMVKRMKNARKQQGEAISS